MPADSGGEALSKTYIGGRFTGARQCVICGDESPVGEMCLSTPAYKKPEHLEQTHNDSECIEWYCQKCHRDEFIRTRQRLLGTFSVRVDEVFSEEQSILAAHF